MFPGKRDKKDKGEFFESMKKNPKLVDQFKRVMISQMLSMVGMKVYEWLIEKPGRKLVVAHDKEDGETGISFEFTEDGEEATPEFLKKG